MRAPNQGTNPAFPFKRLVINQQTKRPSSKDERPSASPVTQLVFLSMRRIVTKRTRRLPFSMARTGTTAVAFRSGIDRASDALARSSLPKEANGRTVLQVHLRLPCIRNA